MKRITAILLTLVMLLGVISSSGLTALAADGAENYPLNSIVIKIEDIVTHTMLGGQDLKSTITMTRKAAATACLWRSLTRTEAA